jgi:hypothetical protein
MMSMLGVFCLVAVFSTPVVVMPGSSDLTPVAPTAAAELSVMDLDEPSEITPEKNTTNFEPVRNAALQRMSDVYL